jgi:hypothetical protein
MRAPVLFARFAPLAPFALSVLLASLIPAALVGCDQDYAESNSGRQTFMGATREIPPSSASAPAAPPMAPPQMGPAPALQPVSDAAADGARGPAAPAPVRPAPAR